jgi:signal transduction histidine kinase
VIAVAVAAMGPMARRKRLTVQVGSAGMPRALGDRDKIRQVLLNLLGNAIKFTPEGGRVDVQVSVGAIVRDEDLGVFVASSPAAVPPALDGANAALASSQPIGARLGIRMAVVDNGIGIAPEKQARIFEPFFQVDSSSTREYGGTGLGLTLVKSYIEAHGGKVWVDSALGRGSMFTITLPAVEDDLFEYLRQNARAAAGEGEGVRRASQSDRTAP